MKPVAAEKDPALLDFEEPLTGAGNVGGCYVNPTGSFRYDDSGQQAYRGIGAMQLTGNGRFQEIHAGQDLPAERANEGQGDGAGADAVARQARETAAGYQIDGARRRRIPADSGDGDGSGRGGS